VCVKPPMWAIDPQESEQQAEQIEELLLG